MSRLVRLYPPGWRTRYGDEFAALLADRPPSARDILDVVRCAIDARLSPQVETASPARRVHVTDRLAGAAAITGGLVWCGTYLLAGLTMAEADYSVPILTAIGLMLLSLPGTYLVSYRRPIVVWAAAFGLSMLALFGYLLPWGPILLVPGLIILGALGPGALTLAAARAGIAARARWRLLLVTLPWPVLGGIFASSGVSLEPITVPLVIASMLPLGIAWIVTGARIAWRTGGLGHDQPPALPGSSVPVAGGIA